MSLLKVSDLRAGFGSNTVLHGVDLTVEEGTIAGIFGLNGAGKSVTLKVLAGIVPARGGSVAFGDTNITDLSAEKRVAMGMGHVPQGRQVFPALTIEENLRLGAYTLRRRDRSRYAGALASVFDRFPVLAERRDEFAGNLSGGQQASLAVARALINEPRLILVDEPTAGLSPIAVAELEETLRSVAASGVTMLLVEQNVGAGLRLVEHVNIMQNGRVVHRAAVGELDRDDLARYLGIGRMLHATTSAALSTRAVSPWANDADGVAPTKVRTPRKRTKVSPKRSAAKTASKSARPVKSSTPAKAPAKRAPARATKKRPAATAKRPTRAPAKRATPAAKKAPARKRKAS